MEAASRLPGHAISGRRNRPFPSLRPESIRHTITPSILAEIQLIQRVAVKQRGGEGTKSGVNENEASPSERLAASCLCPSEVAIRVPSQAHHPWFPVIRSPLPVEGSGGWGWGTKISNQKTTGPRCTWYIQLHKPCISRPAHVAPSASNR